MIERRFLPGFSTGVRTEPAALGPAPEPSGLCDQRELPRCSIDNDGSRDFDQLTCACRGGEGAATILIAIADVDAAVRKGRAIDGYDCRNTTTGYTPVRVFPMIPEELSMELTSRNDCEDRSADGRRMAKPQRGLE